MQQHIDRERPNRSAQQPASLAARWALGLGLAGLLVPLAGLFAMALGRRAVEEIDRETESGRAVGGRESACAGAMLGLVGTTAMLAVVVGALALVALGAGAGSGKAPDTRPATGPATQATSLPARLGRTSKNKAKNEANLGGFCKSLMLWAALNGEAGSDIKFPAGTVAQRFQSTVAGNANDWPMSAAGLISPVENDPSVKQGAKVFYSYALLDGTSAEWANNSNSAVPLVADRKLSDGGSLWTAGQWEGNVGWGDFHVTWEINPVMATSVGGLPIGEDDIFAAPGIAMQYP